MGKRLHVLLSDSEMQEIRRIAWRQRLMVSEWVRRTLSEACLRQSVHDQSFKLKAIRAAAEYSFPTGDIDHMNEEIARGYHR